MKKILSLFTVFIISFSVVTAQSWIRVNQIGYLEDDVKVAVWISKDSRLITEFDLVDVASGSIVYSSDKVKQTGPQPAFNTSARLDFSGFNLPGSYKIRVNETESSVFRIGNDIYAGAADIPLQYMRQQRCGYNPFLKDS